MQGMSLGRSYPLSLSSSSVLDILKFSHKKHQLLLQNEIFHLCKDYAK